MSLALSANARSAVVTLDNESRRNALSGKMMVDLERVVSELERNPSLAVVQLRGKGMFFCSGADLGLADKLGAEMCAWMQNVTSRIAGLNAVSIAVIRGGVYGGGSELSTSCDFRAFARDAKMRWVHTKMGISPGWGGATRLTRIVGRAQALRILCTAPELSVRDCQLLGLADVVADDDKLDEEVAQFLAPILEADPTAIRACKMAVDGASRDSRDSYENEGAAFERVWGAPANVAALERVKAKLGSAAAKKIP